MPTAKEEMRRALAGSHFIPYFQPLVDLRSGGIDGFEILARWQRTRAGLIMPAAFIPCIERFGLMNELTTSLLRQSLDAVRGLPKTFCLSINLSPSQLLDCSLPDIVARIAGEADFDLSRLTLELTESALVDDLHQASSVAAHFKRLGVHLALDDFGTGYSSLLHLQALPFDELKIDISFVRSMVEARQSRKITAAVCSLGMSLGMQTVAEGIETAEQARLLVWQGCTLGQGHLFGRAVPAAELAETLARGPEMALRAELPASAMDPLLSQDSHPMARLSQLQAIYDCAPVGLAFIDQQLRYVNLNQKIAQGNGRSIQAHLGRSVSEMVVPAFYAQFEPYLKRALRGESFPAIEVTRPTTAHAPGRALLLTYHPVRDEAGEVLGVCVAVADISVVKQQEAALRESEDHYRHAVELNPQIPWTMDAEGNTLSISSRWESITGLSVEKTRGGGWLDVVHTDDQQQAIDHVQRSLRTGEPIDVELRILNRDGHWVWMRSRGAPRRNAAGDIIRWYGSLESINEHKLASDQLRRSEAELRAIFQATPAGVVVVDARSRKVLSANPRAEHLLGTTLTPGMAWTAGMWEALDACGRRIDPAVLPAARAIETGEPVGPEDVYIRRKDGSEIWLNISAAPIAIEQGKQFGVVLVIQDAEAGKAECARLLEVAYTLNQHAGAPTVTAKDVRLPVRFDSRSVSTRAQASASQTAAPAFQSVASGD